MNGTKVRPIQADTSDELSAFAVALGLISEWVQKPGAHREQFLLPRLTKREGRTTIGAPLRLGVTRDSQCDWMMRPMAIPTHLTTLRVHH